MSNAGELQGYNLYAYCFNNPINLTDDYGNWPNWGNIFKKVGDVVKAVLSSIETEIGFGVGIGASAKASYYSVPVSAGALAKVDAVSYRSGKGKADIGTSYTAKAGVGAGSASYVAGSTKFHSYTKKSDKCKCNFWADKPGEKVTSIYKISKCPDAVLEPLSSDLSIGFGVEAYFIFGVTADVSFNITYFTEQLIAIFNEE